MLGRRQRSRIRCFSSRGHRIVCAYSLSAYTTRWLRSDRRGTKRISLPSSASQARCVSFLMLTHPRTENPMVMAYKSSWRQEHWLWKMVYLSASRKSRTRTTTRSRIRTRSSKTPISSTPPRRRTSFFGWRTNCFRRRTPRRSSA